mgnify:CR=1 FL=1
MIGSYLGERWVVEPEGWKLLAPPRRELELSDEASVMRYFEKYAPEAILHLAAHRDATSAERRRGERDAASAVWRDNVVATRVLAAAAERHGGFLVHVSTDFVFGGTESFRGPYRESDSPEDDEDVLSWYGVTKREAERLALAAGRNAVVRIGNVTRAGNEPMLDYVGKICALLVTGRLYPMFDDQLVTLTSISALDRLVRRLLATRSAGVFHCASRDRCTPHELGQFLASGLGLDPRAVQGGSVDAFLAQFPRRYPKYGGLRIEATDAALGLTSPSWTEIASQFLKLY